MTYETSAWRPLRGPLYDWPLALCDARTVDFEQDTMPGDIVFTNWTTENLQVMHSSAQKWYWLPGQLPEEVLIFKSAESLKSSAPGQSHHARLINQAQHLHKAFLILAFTTRMFLLRRRLVRALSRESWCSMGTRNAFPHRLEITQVLSRRKDEIQLMCISSTDIYKY